MSFNHIPNFLLIDILFTSIEVPPHFVVALKACLLPYGQCKVMETLNFIPLYILCAKPQLFCFFYCTICVCTLFICFCNFTNLRNAYAITILFTDERKTDSTTVGNVMLIYTIIFHIYLSKTRKNKTPIATEPP